MSECRTCAGGGRVADTDEREPWKYWQELPTGSAIALILGIVKPITCPDCKGTGTVSTDPTHEQVIGGRE